MIIGNFTPFFALDMIQAYKANIIQSYISDRRISNALQGLLSAETSFLRQVIKSTTDVYTAFFDDALTETNKVLKKIH